MDGPEDREGSLPDGSTAPPDTKPAEARYSSRFLNSLGLILMGATLGVFWREVFQLTIRAVEMLGR